MLKLSIPLVVMAIAASTTVEISEMQPRPDPALVTATRCALSPETGRVTVEEVYGVTPDVALALRRQCVDVILRNTRH